MNDTNAIWKCGKEKLNESLEHLTTVNANIKLTVKKEANNLQEISDTKFTRIPHIQSDIFSMSAESRFAIRTIVKRTRSITVEKSIPEEL